MTGWRVATLSLHSIPGSWRTPAVQRKSKDVTGGGVLYLKAIMDSNGIIFTLKAGSHGYFIDFLPAL